MLSSKKHKTGKLVLVIGLLMALTAGYTEPTQQPEAAPNAKPKPSKTFFPGIPPEWPPKNLQLPQSAFNKNCEQPRTPELDKVEYTYKHDFYGQLLPKWNFLATYKGIKPVFIIEISKDGHLDKIDLLKSSGVDEIDQQALSVLKSFTLPAFPKKYTLPTMHSIVSYDFTKYYFETTPQEREMAAQQFNNAATPWILKVIELSRKAWNPRYIKANTNRQAVILIKLDPGTGQVYGKEVVVTSCEPDLDASALKAVDKMGNFPVVDISLFPPDHPHDFMMVFLTFDYQLLTYKRK